MPETKVQSSQVHQTHTNKLGGPKFWGVSTRTTDTPPLNFLGGLKVSSQNLQVVGPFFEMQVASILQNLFPAHRPNPNSRRVFNILRFFSPSRLRSSPPRESVFKMLQIIRYLKCRLHRTSKTLFLPIAPIPIRDYFLISFDFSPPVNCGISSGRIGIQDVEMKFLLEILSREVRLLTF